MAVWEVWEVWEVWISKSISPHKIGYAIGLINPFCCIARSPHCEEALLRGPKNLFNVISWLDHGIQKTTKNTNNISILNWIPLQARGMTIKKLVHAGNACLQ
nr:hypothetical protein [Rickettsia tamurae]